MNKIIFQTNDFVDASSQLSLYANGLFGRHVHTLNPLFSGSHTNACEFGFAKI